MTKWLLLKLCAVYAGACYYIAPSILGNISCAGSSDCMVATRTFDSVLQHRFPVGSSERALETELLSEHFQHFFPSFSRCVNPKDWAKEGASIPCPAWDPHWDPRHHLIYRFYGPSIVCGREISVRWSSDELGRITHIEGHYSVACL